MNSHEEKLLNGFTRQGLFDLFTPDFDKGLLFRNVRERYPNEPLNVYKSWITRFSGKRADRENSLGYMVVSIGDKKLLAHRVLWFMKTGEIPTEIDHKNGIKSDNSFDNLRNVTHDKNLENGKGRVNSTTGVTGVHFYKSRGKWTAHITKHGKTNHLGYFDVMEDAIAARTKAEQEFNFERFQKDVVSN